MMTKASLEDTTRIQKIERGFKLPLRTWVEGLDCSGKPFREETILAYISNRGASFSLDAEVALGAKLRLSIDLPPKLAGGGDLNLVLKGRVVFIEATPGKNTRQKISLKLESRYLIQAESQDPQESACDEK
jgi:hypothetical protein